MEIAVSFSGGKKVDASLREFTIRTDQPESSGGEGSAPTPFELFLASIATCAGIYVLNFCQERNIPADGIRLVEKVVRDQKTRHLDKVSIEIHIPKDFPEKYRTAVAKTAELCAVKKAIANPPAFEVKTVVNE